MPQHKKHIIIAVIGLTPQIITETLYALAVREEKSIIPHAIYVITTLEGKKQVIRKLLDDGKGKYYQFCGEYGIDSSRIEFDESTIFVVRDLDNRPLEDIRNNTENETVANFIINFVRDKAQDMDTIIHASAAGGRKTMSIYLAYAMSLFGRKDDMLYHVLVSPPEYESSPDFYYIGKSASPNYARIELAEIPFIRLREKLEQLELSSGMSYGEMVRRSQGELDLLQPLPEIKIYDKSGKIFINNRELVLRPLSWAVYRTFIEQKTDHCVRHDLDACGDCLECFLDMQGILADPYLDRIFKWYKHITKLDDDRIAASRKSSDEDKWHRQKFAHINKEIRNQFRDRNIERYCSITSDRKTQGKRYGILIDKNKIQAL